jgi:alpha-tubulin suppressor-like RCC1 family protein
VSPIALGMLADVVQVALGGNGGCARLMTGQVYCWGANDEGQLGQGKTDMSNTFPPVMVPGITDAVYVARSSNHACVAHASGTVSCWGANLYGQVTGDDKPTTNEASPVAVSIPQL